MATMTLEEFKAQNAAKEEQSTEEENQSLPEISDEDLEEIDDEEPEIEDDEDDEPDSDDEESKPVEAPDWAKSDSDDNDSDTVPLAKHIKVRSDLKSEKNELKEQVKALEAKISELTSGNTSTVAPRQTATKLRRPRKSDFDYDKYDDPDTAYEEALDKYYDDKEAQREAERTGRYEQESAQKLYNTRIQNAVNGHYERAEQLVKDKLVTAEAYQKADANIKSMFEQLNPEKGEAFANELISQLENLGEGSEKLWFQIGNSQKVLTTLRDKFVSDKTGLSAMGYLGVLHAKISDKPSKKRNSRAPKPATKLQGDATSSTKSAAEKKFLKRYKAAGDDVQTRLDVKMEAKAAGVDTSKW